MKRYQKTDKNEEKVQIIRHHTIFLLLLHHSSAAGTYQSILFAPSSSVVKEVKTLCLDRCWWVLSPVRHVAM